jgi:hypothetical protein
MTRILLPHQHNHASAGAAHRNCLPQKAVLLLLAPLKECMLVPAKLAFHRENVAELLKDREIPVKVTLASVATAIVSTPFDLEGGASL